MASSEKHTTRIENTRSKSSVPAVIAETHQEVSSVYSENLHQEISDQMSLTGNYCKRLQHLIHSEVEALEHEYLTNTDNGEGKTRKLSHETVHNIKELGYEFRESVKLMVALAGVKMRIEKGESS